MSILSEPLSLMLRVMRSELPDFLVKRMEMCYFRRVRDDWGGRHLLRGLQPGPGSILLNSNDYLSLSRHPEIVGAHQAAQGQGTFMSAVFLRRDNACELLEAELAGFLGHAASMLCQSGWAANTGLLQSVAGPGDPVYFDMMSHASLLEGARSAGARQILFRHNDVEDMCDQIREGGPGIVVAESVYSTDGALCPLADLTRAAAEMGCMVVIDESHSLGTHGEHGEGLVASLRLHPWVHVVTASLSKAFVGRGGLLACPKDLCEYLRFTSLPAIFSSALLDHEISCLATALKVIRSEPQRRRRLWINSRRLRSGLDALGYAVSSGTEQIIALEPGRESMTMDLRDALEARGIFGAVFCPPATPMNRAIVRLSVHSGLQDSDMEAVLAACAEIRELVRLEDWRSSRRRRGQGMGPRP